MNLPGSLIRLFLVDENPNGLKTAEISNMTIFTTMFPRAKLKDFLSREEAKKPGCYILLGSDIHNPDETIAYIGESESVDTRLRSHADGKNQKDFWDETIVFTSKDSYITKTQIQYLESEMYRLADEAGNVKLANTQIPTKPRLSEVDNAEMEHFLDAIRLILSSVGTNILEPKTAKTTPPKSVKEEEIIYKFSVHQAEAEMKIEEDKYIVLQGSTAVRNDRQSAQPAIKKMRVSLVENGILKETNDKELLTFTDDYIFNSPSYAAAAIAGGGENGRKQWKYKGKSLNEIELEELK